MKPNTRIHYIAICLLTSFLISCDEDSTNLPPRPFQVKVDWAAKNFAQLSWWDAIDPEDDNLSYTIYLDGELVINEYTENAYILSDLLMDTPYSGEVHAIDEQGNTTVGSFEFTTKGVRIYEGNLVFSYQKDVDNFMKECYSIINGDVTIGINYGSDIHSLTNLSCITEIRGHLAITSNLSLKTLEGLDNLVSIGKNLLFSVNGLESFQGLQNLVSVGGTMQISGSCPSAIAGFDQLQSIGGGLEIEGTPAQTINGFNNLVAVDRISIFNNNTQLASIKGFESLQSIPGHLDIYGNYVLSEFDAFENIESIGDYLRLAHMGTVQTIGGFTKLNEVLGLDISGNQHLTDLSNFAMLERINTIYIEANGALRSFNFRNVITCESLNIQFNPSLTDINGVDGLTVVKDIYIYRNNNLEHLDGLANIHSLTSKHLVIFGNLSLDDYCGITQIITNTVFGPYEYTVEENKFNPTVENIQSGFCKL